jgi:ribosomal protein L19
MFNKILTRCGLFNLSKKEVTKLSQQKESIFDNTAFNPYHISPWRWKRRNNVPGLRDLEPKVNYIPPAMKENRQELLTKLAKEEVQKIKSVANYKKEEVKLGDTVELEYFHSITSQKLYKYKGTVLGTFKEGTINYGFKFLTIVGGEYVVLIYRFYSPMINSIRVLNKGNRNPKLKKIYLYRKVTQMGIRLKEIMKGGKSVNVNKARRKKLQLEDRMKEDVVLE